MGGDYTRFTFRPDKGYAGVRSQQGRVSLDADFNELGDILDRRWRSETIDIIGRCVVPMSTPDAFLIAITNAGQITIGPGRAYADGIQVECAGSAPIVYDDSLGEQHGTTPLPFGLQPFLYPNMPTLSGGPTDLVYLDVWSREVTVLEDPDLHEPALGGPDTTTRVQTAWQVKVLANSGATSCSDVPPMWTQLTAASTARLSSAAPPGAPGALPCVIEPEGGYTGLENRLYRVEIHSVGSDGTLGGAQRPQFKWSRNNGTLATAVTAIVAAGPGRSTVTVTSTGLDEILRFAVGDYVELLDDATEFAMRESGTGGRIARIAAPVDYANSEITVDQDWTAFALVPGRHPRLRRWDVDEDNAGQAVLRDCVPGAAIALEKGITITFDNDPAATVHAGDHWVFHARTAIGRIEELHSAPPRGILHHYCKLALVANGVVVQDCRDHWPPAGCCTVGVRPGEDIQSAIDSLPPEGGCVCLKTGVHVITRPLQIVRSNVTLHGETIGATVRNTANDFMVEISGTANNEIENVNIEKIRFQGTPSGEGVLILISHLRGGGVRDCILEPRQGVGGGALPTPIFFGIMSSSSRGLAFEGNAIRGVLGGIWGFSGGRLTIRANSISGLTYQPNLALPPFCLSEVGIRLEDGLQGWNVVGDNPITNFHVGVYIGPAAQHTLVTGNRISREQIVAPSFFPADPALSRLLLQPGNPYQRAFAIEVHAPHSLVADNGITMVSPSNCGIAVTASHVTVERNDLTSTMADGADSQLGAAPLGIVAFAPAESAVSQVTLRTNTLTGIQGAIAAIAQTATGLAGVEIVDNRIEGRFDQIEQLTTDVNENPAVAVNRVVTLGPLIESTFGIHLDRVIGAQVLRNQVTAAVVGIIAEAVAASTLGGNHVYRTALGTVLQRCQRLHFDGNVADMTPLGAMVAAAVTDSRFEHSTVRRTAGVGLASINGGGNRFSGNRVREGGSGLGLIQEDDARVDGNELEALGRGGIALIFGRGDFTFAGNRLTHCGWRGFEILGFRFAVSLIATGVVGGVDIQGCEVYETGRLSGDQAFAGPRLDIAVVGATTARAHGCTVGGERIDRPDPGSRAIFLAPWPFTGGGRGRGAICADITDSFVEASGLPLVECLGQRQADVIFASNRCENFAAAAGNDPTVSLTGRVVTATGNQIRARGNAPALRISVGNVVSAVANATTAGAAINPVNALRPAPYNTFNVIL